MEPLDYVAFTEGVLEHLTNYFLLSNSALVDSHGIIWNLGSKGQIINYWLFFHKQASKQRYSKVIAIVDDFVHRNLINQVEVD